MRKEREIGRTPENATAVSENIVSRGVYPSEFFALGYPYLGGRQGMDARGALERVGVHSLV